MLEKIREFLYGRKTYILGGIAVATALIAWASTEITGVALITAVFVALQSMFIRAGIKKAEFGNFDYLDDDTNEIGTGP